MIRSARNALAPLLALAAAAACGASASAAVPPGGTHFYGFVGGEASTILAEVSAELRLSPNGRRFSRRGKGSYVIAEFQCGRGRSQRFLQETIRLATRRGPALRVRRDGASR